MTRTQGVTSSSSLQRQAVTPKMCSGLRAERCKIAGWLVTCGKTINGYSLGTLRLARSP